VEDALDKYWDGLSGRGIAQNEEVLIARAATCKSHPSYHAVQTAMTAQGSTPATYGEVTPKGARRIFAALGLLDAEDAHGVQYVFLDLGSGVGKLVAQAYLELPSVVRSIGVELSPTRSLHASEAWGAMVASGCADELRAEIAPTPKTPAETERWMAKEAVKLVEGDIFEADISETTHAYIASLCFDRNMMMRLAEKIGGSTLHAVATLKQFPNGIPGFYEDESFGAEMTWSCGNAQVHLYRRL